VLRRQRSTSGVAAAPAFLDVTSHFPISSIQDRVIGFWLSQGREPGFLSALQGRPFSVPAFRAQLCSLRSNLRVTEVLQTLQGITTCRQAIIQPTVLIDESGGVNSVIF